MNSFKLKKYFIIAFLIMLVTQNINAQSISGIVTDADTKEVLPFVSVSIDGTSFGVSTDIFGKFELKIPKEIKEGKLITSYIGYYSNDMQISNIIGKKDLSISLKVKFQQIKAVEVNEKSLLPYSILKKACNKISDNYTQNSYNYNIYYNNEISYSKINQKREAIVIFYDKKGYNRSNPFNTFKECNYDFVQAKRNFDVKTISDGNTNLDELFEFDIVRNSQNVLDINRMKEFDIKIEKEIIYAFDSVWVLNYKCINPGLFNTGDNSTTAYSGKIYVKKKDFAIVYNETNVKSTNQSELGRGLYLKDKKSGTVINYKFISKYQKTGNFYALKSIEYESNATDSKKQNINTKSFLNVMTVDYQNIKIVEKRVYVENTAYNYEFWKNFSLKQ